MRFVPLEMVPALEAALSAEIECGSWTRARDALAMALGLHGLRVGEVCRALRADLFVAGCRLHVATLKGGRPRDVPLHESLVSALLEWRGAAAHHPWLLYTRPGGQMQRSHLERAARRFTHQVLSESVRFHSLRHTFAMRLYAESHDLFLVQRLLDEKVI